MSTRISRRIGFSYYIHDGSVAFRFQLIGDLSTEGVEELEQVLLTASSVIGQKELIADLTHVSSIDGFGEQLLARWYRRGARLMASTPKAKQLLDSITKQPIEGPARLSQPLHRRSMARLRRIAALFLLLLLTKAARP